MLKQIIRKLYVYVTLPKLSVDTMFRKYLLTTNILSSGILLGMGDFIQQEFEYRQKPIGKRYDLQRSCRMFAVGLALGPVHHYFYKYLDILIPKQDVYSVIKKILVDQFVAGPIFITMFFHGVGGLEGKTFQERNNEMKQKFLTVYAVDWLVWPPTQFINFYYLPPQYRVLYINGITTVYDVFLSYVKHYDKEETISMHNIKN